MIKELQLYIYYKMKQIKTAINACQLCLCIIQGIGCILHGNKMYCICFKE